MSIKGNDNSKLFEDNNENKTNNIKKSKKDINESYSNIIKLMDEKETNSEEPFINYITQIEQLQNELKLEKSISNTLKNSNGVGEELAKLQKILQEKEQKLLKLKQINDKQEEVLIELKKKISKEFARSKKSYSQNNYKNHNTTKNNEIMQNEAVNIVLKVKDKELNDAIQKMNSLKKENQVLKNELYKNDDYIKKIEISNNSKENTEKIRELNTELKLLNKQLLEHKACIEEQNKNKNVYNELKKKLKELKNDTSENKTKIKTYESISYLNTEPKEKNLLFNRIYNKKNKKTITPKSEKKANKITSISISRNNNILFPPISSSRKSSKNKSNNLYNNNEQSILTNDFVDKIKNYFEHKNDLETLLIKIDEIEKSRMNIENKHKSEINQFNKQINTLDEQFQLLNSNGKYYNTNIRVLKYKLNIIKGETKASSKKYVELKKELDSLETISKQKDYEISVLLGQINSLRNLANDFSETIIPEDKIDVYINKLKNDKSIDKNFNNKNNDNEKDKNVNNNLLSSYFAKKNINNNKK